MTIPLFADSEITLIVEANPGGDLFVGCASGSGPLLEPCWGKHPELKEGQIVLLAYDAVAKTLTFALDGVTDICPPVTNLTSGVRLAVHLSTPGQMIRLITAVDDSSESTDDASRCPSTALTPAQYSCLSPLKKQLASLRRSVWHLQQIVALVCLDMKAHAPEDAVIDLLMDAIAEPLSNHTVVPTHAPVTPSVGDRVLARWKNGLDRSFPDWYGAVVLGANVDGTFSLIYDDKCSDSCVPTRLIRPAAVFYADHMEPLERIALHSEAVQACALLSALAKHGNRCVVLELQRQPWLDRLSAYVAMQTNPTSNRRLVLSLVEAILHPMHVDAGSKDALALVTLTLVDLAAGASIVPAFVARECERFGADEDSKAATRPPSTPRSTAETVEGAPKGLKILSALLNIATEEVLLARDAANVLATLTSTAHWHWKNLTVRLSEVLRSIPALVDDAAGGDGFAPAKMAARFAEALSAAAALSRAPSFFSADETATLLRFAIDELEAVAGSDITTTSEDFKTRRVQLASALLKVCGRQMEESDEVLVEIASDTELLEKIATHALQTLPVLASNSISANVFAARMRVRSAARAAHLSSSIVDASAGAEVWGAAPRSAAAEEPRIAVTAELDDDAPSAALTVSARARGLCTQLAAQAPPGDAAPTARFARVSTEDLRVAVQYCEHILEHGEADVATAARAGALDRLPAGVLHFVDVADGGEGLLRLFAMIRAANELGCQSLLDLACAKVVSLVVGLLDEDAPAAPLMEAKEKPTRYAWLDGAASEVQGAALAATFALAVQRAADAPEWRRVVLTDDDDDLFAQHAVQETFLRFMPWGGGPWRYVDVSPRGVGIRASPSYPGDRVDPNEAIVGGAVVVVERITKTVRVNAENEPCAPHPVTFLRLEDGRGWVFDCLPADGTPLMKCTGVHQRDATVLGPLPALSGGALAAVDFRSLRLQRALRLLSHAPTLPSQRCAPFTDLVRENALDAASLSRAARGARSSERGGSQARKERMELSSFSLGERACERVSAVHNSRDILLLALRCWSLSHSPASHVALPPALHDGASIMQLIKINPESAFAVLPSILDSRNSIGSLDVANLVTCAVRELLGAAIETCDALNQTVALIPDVRLDISEALARSARRVTALPVAVGFSFQHPASRSPRNAGFVVDAGNVFPTFLPSELRGSGGAFGARSPLSRERSSSAAHRRSERDTLSRQRELRRRSSRGDEGRDIAFGWTPLHDHEPSFFARDRSSDSAEFGRMDGAAPPQELPARHLGMMQLAGGVAGHENRSEWIVRFPPHSALARARYRVCIECCDASFHHAATFRINGTNAGPLGDGHIIAPGVAEHAWFVVETTDGELRIDSSATELQPDAPACLSAVYIEGPLPLRPRPADEAQFFRKPEATLALQLLDRVFASREVFDLLLTPAVLPMVSEFTRVSSGSDRLLAIRLVHSALTRQHGNHCDGTHVLESPAAVHARLAGLFEWLPQTLEAGQRSEAAAVAEGSVFSTEVQLLAALHASIERYNPQAWAACAPTASLQYGSDGAAGDAAGRSATSPAELQGEFSFVPLHYTRILLTV